MLVDPLPRFQSAPLTEARGDQAHRRHFRPFQAPLTEARGDILGTDGTTCPNMFQSAPLTEARGDEHDLPNTITPGFNPLPLPKHLNGTLYGQLVTVSIRSPYRSKGRHSTGNALEFSTMFQSAPLTEARGDKIIIQVNPLPLPKHCFCFNPLPLPKQGEDHHVNAVALLRCFNPLPLPKQGETSDDASDHL